MVISAAIYVKHMRRQRCIYDYDLPEMLPDLAIYSEFGYISGNTDNFFFDTGSYGTAVGTGVVGSCPSTFGGGYGGGIRARRTPFEIAIGECLSDNDCAGKLICCPFDGFSRCAVPQY